MAKWFEEVRLGNRSLVEIGAAFYIREMLGNNCLVNKWDLKSIFGEGYAAILENLQQAGMLKVEAVGSQLRLSIVAPGDRKRTRCKQITQINRDVEKFEKRITRDGARGSRQAATDRQKQRGSR